MKLRRLRIVGFKSFVDPTDVPIEPGLTGIVGPNGCGKSNLVEALRWAMGESSHKSLRAAGMDDVIFAGSQARPARNFAEVTLGLDNSSRTAPAAFNDADSLDISRRIEREQGSTYRINGREVRARDVQILFADAATGARSPAMVRQGQIGEIISAKPQARRRILEDAAGIAGLHARRHEAELRLKAAEANLTRVEDLVGQIDTRLEQLRKQARQAARYRTVAAEIRKAEALLLLIAIREAEAAALQAQRDLDAATREVAQAQHVQTQAATAQAVAAHAAPKLREEAAAAAAAVHRLTSAREALDLEERRARARAAELERRSHELRNDLERERAHAADAGLNLDRLSAERTELETASAQPSLAEVPLVARLEAGSSGTTSTRSSGCNASCSGRSARSHRSATATASPRSSRGCGPSSTARRRARPRPRNGSLRCARGWPVRARPRPPRAPPSRKPSARRSGSRRRPGRYESS
jgi:chromosome segregation protein